MHESPAAALRRKPSSSIRIAVGAVADGRAAAVVSAGNTGATVMASHAALGLLPGVQRPALATAIPTKTSRAVLLDVGANAECRPAHLLHFAVMGSVYAQLALGIAEPRVGLLSIGEEETKGNELTRDAHRALKDAPVRFIGNVEARDVYSGVADVIVCDGFTGNVALKVSEGLAEMVEALLREELSSTFSTRVGYLLSLRAFRRFRKARGLLGVRRGAAARRGRRGDRGARTFVGEGRAQRDPAGVAVLARSPDLADRAGHRWADGERIVIAFVFPGQGSQRVGMGQALAETFPECRAVFEEADEALGEPLEPRVLRGS